MESSVLRCQTLKDVAIERRLQGHATPHLATVLCRMRHSCDPTCVHDRQTPDNRGDLATLGEAGAVGLGCGGSGCSAFPPTPDRVGRIGADMTKRLDRRARGGGEGAGPRQTPREKRLARKQEREEPPVLRTPTTDQLLIDVLADGAELARLRTRGVTGSPVDVSPAAGSPGEGTAAGVVRVLTTTSGRGQAAIVLAGQAGCRVVCQVLDEFAAGLVRAHVAGTRVEVVCAASFPEQSFELVALALDHRTETELTRELVQAGAVAVVPGGRLVCATGKADDQLIHGELKRLF